MMMPIVGRPRVGGHVSGDTVKKIAVGSLIAVVNKWSKDGRMADTMRIGRVVNFETNDRLILEDVDAVDGIRYVAQSIDNLCLLVSVFDRAPFFDDSFVPSTVQVGERVLALRSHVHGQSREYCQAHIVAVSNDDNGVSQTARLKYYDGVEVTATRLSHVEINGVLCPSVIREVPLKDSRPYKEWMGSIEFLRFDGVCGKKGSQASKCKDTSGIDPAASAIATERKKLETKGISSEAIQGYRDRQQDIKEARTQLMEWDALHRIRNENEIENAETKEMELNAGDAPGVVTVDSSQRICSMIRRRGKVGQTFSVCLAEYVRITDKQLRSVLKEGNKNVVWQLLNERCVILYKIGALLNENVHVLNIGLETFELVIDRSDKELLSVNYCLTDDIIADIRYNSVETVGCNDLTPLDSSKVGVWEFGVMMCYLLYGFFPFSNEYGACLKLETTQRVLKGGLSILLENDNPMGMEFVPFSAIDLLNKIFKFEKERLTMKQVMNHPFWNNTQK